MKELTHDVCRMMDITAGLDLAEIGELYLAMLTLASGEEPEVSGRAARAWSRIRASVMEQVQRSENRSRANTKNVTKRYEQPTNCCESATNDCETPAKSYEQPTNGYEIEREEREGFAPLDPPSPLSSATPIPTPPYNPPTPEREETPPRPSDEAPQGAAPQKRAAHSIPTLEEVEDYAMEAQLPMDVNAFYDHFSSNGWKVSGKTPMKDWKAAMRQWARREKDFKLGKNPAAAKDAPPKDRFHSNNYYEQFEVDLENIDPNEVQL